MTTVTPTRPKMGSRAISDMNPLMSPSGNIEKGNLGRGTQATSGGAKVTSCSRTALGGMAPLSPFLPLPPAPTSEELQRRCSNEKALFVDAKGGASHVRFASSLDNEAAGKKTRAAALSNAPHMIRSYSMPVATQRDYEVQREMLRKKQQWPNAINGGSLASQPQNRLLANANTMTTSKSTMGVVGKAKHQLDCDTQHPFNYRKTVSKPSPRSTPRSALSTISYNEVHFRNESNEVDMESGSDEAEVVTPRALSPATTDYFEKASSAPPFDNLSFFIHPSHLQPPVGFTSS